MKRFAIATIITLALVVSCAPTSTPQLPAALATATQAAMVTLFPTETPMVSLSPTFTNTPAPTNTPTPTATLEPSPTPKPTVAPTETPAVERVPAAITSTLFFADYAKNGFNGFVWNGQSTARPGAPGQSDLAKYSIVTDEKMGKVFKAVQTGQSPIEDGKTRAFVQLAVKDIIGKQSIEGNFGTHFKVNVSNLEPGLKLAKESNWTKWIVMWSAFDSGYPNYHQSVFVQLSGTDGHYRMITTVTDPSGKNTVLDRFDNAPEFNLGDWIDIRVEVDVENNIVYTYQDGKLISQGLYTAGTKSLSETHWGDYNNLSQAVVMNAQNEIYSWK